MTELEQLKTLITNIETLINQYKTSITTSVTTSITSVPLDTREDLTTHIKNWFDANTVTSKDKNIMTAYANPYNWPRNSNCWAKNLDLTGYAACIVPLGGVGGGTLITKKHVLLANHVPYSNSPFMIFFVNNKNVSLVYNVIKTKRVTNTDILIGELDREVDASLKVYSVLPANYSKYLDKQINFPILYSDQERKALIGEYGGVNNTYGTTNTIVNISKDTNKALYFEALIGGDSGNITSTVVDNEIVLIGAWYMTLGSTAGLATNIPSYVSDINSTIASLSPGYKLSEANLAKFKMYT